MRKLLSTFLLLVLGAGFAAAQDGWMNSYSAAMALSKKTRKPVLAFFTGSDWCGWCMKLDEEVFNKPAFGDWASQNVIPLVLDYPHNIQQPDFLKRQNGKLLGKYGVRAFPTILVLNWNGDKMAEQGYEPGGPNKWVADIEGKVNQWLAGHQLPKSDTTEAYEDVSYEKKTLYATTDIRGQKAPEISVQEWLNGSAPKTKGKTVLIDFWATWCGPCREFEKSLDAWAKEFGDDLVIIGVSAESADVVRKYMADHPMKYKVAVDPSSKMSNALGVSGIPHVLVISADGIVRWQGFPQNEVDPLTEEKLATIIMDSSACNRD